MNDVRTTRSALFVPGDRPDRFAKAAATGALVLLDLEDAVAPSSRARARQDVRRWLEDGGRAVVRVQAASSPEHGADVAAIAGAAGLIGVMLARAERAEDVRGLHDATGVPVVALVETAAGIAAAGPLASCAARLALGDQDLALDFGVCPRSALVQVLAAQIVLASRLAGLPRPLDGVTPEIDDVERLRADATTGRDGGFGGKLCIHPRQVETVEQTYRPTEQEIRWARGVVAATTEGCGVTTADGAMVDRPLLERARAVLRDA